MIIDRATYYTNLFSREYDPGSLSGDIRVKIAQSWSSATVAFDIITATPLGEEYLRTVNKLAWDGSDRVLAALVYTDSLVEKMPRFWLLSTVDVDMEDEQAVFYLADVNQGIEQVNCTATAWYDVNSGMMSGIDISVA